MTLDKEGCHGTKTTKGDGYLSEGSSGVRGRENAWSIDRRVQTWARPRRRRKTATIH